MIGSNLVKRLVAREGYAGRVFVVDNLWRGSLANLLEEVTGENSIPLEHFFQRDLIVPGALDDIIKAHDVDTIIHLADIVAGI